MIPLRASSYDPDEIENTIAVRMAAIGVFAAFAGIQHDNEAVRRFERLKPKRQRDHINEFENGLRWFRRAGGSI